LSVQRGRNLRERYSQGKDAPRSTCRRYTRPGNVTKTPKGNITKTPKGGEADLRVGERSQKEAVHEQQQQLRRDGSAKDPIVVDEIRRTWRRGQKTKGGLSYKSLQKMGGASLHRGRLGRIMLA